MDSIYEQRIETVGLPLRASNVLRRYHIDTVGELLEHGRNELCHMHGFGRACWKAVDEFISSNGLTLRR